MNAKQYLICLGILLLSEQSLRSQVIDRDFGPRRAAAVNGQPYGVVIAELPVPPEFNPDAIRVLVEDDQQRILYPAVSVRTVEISDQPAPRNGGRLLGNGALIDRLRNVVRGGPNKRQVPVAITVAALYRGDGPIRLRVVGDIQQELVVPTVASANQTELLDLWWETYVTASRRTIETADHPNLVQKYLTATLAHRLGLPQVDLDPPDEKNDKLAQPLDTLALLAAIEPLRDEVLEQVLVGNYAAQPGTLPQPQEPTWLPPNLPPALPNVVVETLATRVPPECFYIRFGSFNNFVWFQELSTRFGGDIAQAVLMRGFNYEATQRMERMLGAKLNGVAKMFGDKIIDDMALIGTDLYVKEGASLGSLFSTRNAALLVTTMQSERKALASKTEGASLQTVQLAGRDVSLLSTPDNRLRSFLVSDGNYVLVTTSSNLAQRFLEISAGGPSLADLPSFKWARTWMPEANHYSVFGFFAPEFFNRLVSPQYQIELKRRLEAIAHLEIAEMASAVGAAEGIDPNDLVSLGQAGLLPPKYDQRSDGARVLRNNTGWIDSLRGARGSFLPIADVELQGVTEAEQAQYVKLANFYQNNWQQMDPLLVGLRRFQVEGHPGIERIAVEGYVAPFGAEKYGWITQMLGQPTPLQIVQPADDVLSVQMHLSGYNPIGPATRNYHLFGGIKDMVPPAPEDTKGLIKTLQALKAMPGYVGAWPMPGLLDQLPLGLGGGPPDFTGFSRMIGGLWRWRSPEGFSLLSFDRTIMEHAIPQLATLATNDVAQVRMKLAPLKGSRLSGWVNQQWFERGWKASHGNARLLDSVTQQLKVPGDAALTVTERLLDVRLQCPVGGDFVFQKLPGNSQGGWWTSTAWANAVVMPDGKLGPSPDYNAPWIEWFRGSQLHLTQLPDRLAVVGTVDLELPPPLQVHDPDEKADLMPPFSFDIFKLPFEMLGKKAATEPERKNF